jgi:hypothetical protein
MFSVLTYDLGYACEIMVKLGVSFVGFQMGLEEGYDSDKRGMEVVMHISS